MRALPSPRTTTFEVRGHLVALECLERLRWRVCVDGRLLAIFGSESRARIAGRTEARRLEFIERDPARRVGSPRRGEPELPARAVADPPSRG